MSNITPGGRKLKAVWTREAAQDLLGQHNLKAEKELSDLLAAEISAEIDEEILNDLRNAKKMEQEIYYKKKKKVQYARSIDEDWEVSRAD